jgi:hypothetical protein
MVGMRRRGTFGKSLWNVEGGWFFIFIFMAGDTTNIGEKVTGIANILMKLL